MKSSTHHTNHVTRAMRFTAHANKRPRMPTILLVPLVQPALVHLCRDEFEIGSRKGEGKAGDRHAWQQRGRTRGGS